MSRSQIETADVARLALEMKRGCADGPVTPRFVFLLGAGASATAGIPLAKEMVARLKKRFYCEDRGLDPQGDVDPDEINAHIRG